MAVWKFCWQLFVLELLDGRAVIGQDWAQFDRFRYHLSLVVDAIALDIQDEHLVRVLSAPEGKLLLELLITIWCKHYVDSLALTRLQSA